jgi:hypothetical protein
MDRHLEFLRGLQHLAKDVRAFHAGDFEAVSAFSANETVE